MAIRYEGKAAFTFAVVVFLALSSSYMAEAFICGLIVNKAPTHCWIVVSNPASNVPCQAFQKTWNDVCASEGDATVVIPKGTFTTGQVFFQGSCNASSITVEVQGTLKALTDINEFPSPEWFSIQHVSNVHVKGSGTFDGQGASIWSSNDCSTNDNYVHRPPVIMKVTGVNNSIIEDSTSLNAKGFHFHVTNSNNITVRHVTITAPDDSPKSQYRWHPC
ncbi:hypothetical protein QQ045_002569 [Rhodiola kirilowii]